MNNIDTLIIIPTYNEKENIRRLTSSILDIYSKADILIVDDNSPDGTGRIATELEKKEERINVLNREKKEGLGRAYIAGFRWALKKDYSYIMEMDCDFSHDPNEILNFRNKMNEGYDLTLGSRYIDGIRVMNWPLSRLILSKGAGLYVKFITGMPFTDPTGGFKCFHRSLLESYDFKKIEASGYGFQIELTHKAWINGYAIAEIPITFEDRQAGTSKMSGSIVYEALWVVWKLALGNKLRRRPAYKSPR
ncbi:MAG: polyprenol monophosphomannose synthase [Pontiellaceae bacterium]